MPKNPEWYGRIGDILIRVSEMAKSSSVTLNRADIEHVFGVKRTEAKRILQLAGGTLTGRDLRVSARELLSYLESRKQSAGIARERKRRIARTVNYEAAVQPAKEVTFRLDRKQLERVTCHDIPATVEIEPGLMRVRFSDARDLGRQLLILGNAMLFDWHEFEKLAGQSECASVEPLLKGLSQRSSNEEQELKVEIEIHSHPVAEGVSA